MSLDIRGASGNLWEITRLGRGKVLSLAQAPQAQNALVDGLTFTASGAQTPTGAGDYFFYMAAASTATRPIVISRLAVDGGTLDAVSLNAVTGTPVSGTTLTPINRTRGSSKVTTATIQDGVDITGLTSAGTLERIILVANNNNSLVFVDRPIVLQAGQAIALAADTGTAAINFRVDFWVDLSDPQVVP